MNINFFKFKLRPVFLLLLVVCFLISTLSPFFSSFFKPEVIRAQAEKPEVISKRTAESKTYDNGDGTFTSKIWGLPVHYKDDKGNWQEYADNQKPEIISKRTSTSKTYDNGDGTLTLNFWGLPVHYQDDNKSWQDINTTIVPSTDPDYDFMNITNNTKTYFGADAYGAKDNVKLQKGNASVTFKTVNKLTIKNKDGKGNEVVEEEKTKDDLKPKDDKEKVEKKGQKIAGDDGIENKIKYNKVFEKGSKKIDVTYTVLDYKLQEEIVLNEFQGFPEMSQEIKLTNAYAKIEGKTIVIYHQDTNEFLWLLPEPRMFEQDNVEQTNTGLHYELKCNNKNGAILALSEVEGEQCSNLTLTKIFDQEGKDWLSDPQRQYPVVIDPDFAGDAADGEVQGANADINTARATSTGSNLTSVNTGVGQYMAYTIMRSYLKFDTSAIGAGSTITQVNLKLVCVSDGSATDFDVQIVKQDWSAQDPIVFGTREAAYDGSLAGTADANIWRNTSGMSINTQYTSGNLATDWPSKIGNTYYSLRSSRDKAGTTPTGNEYIYLAATENATAAYRPVLVVTLVPDFPGSTADGYIYGYDATYATARATSTTYVSNNPFLWVGHYGSPYYVFRSFLKFNTSLIPDDNIIIQVNLKLVCTSDNSATDFDVQIVKQNWLAQDPLSDANREAAYDNCLAGTADDNIWRNTSGMSLNTQYTSGNLNTAWPSKTGNTYYCLRSNRDLNANQPSGGEDIYIAAAENATFSYRPLLVVTYTTNTAPSAPTTLYVNESASGAQSGESNPAAVGDSTPVFSAVYADTDTGDIANYYQLIVYSDAACTSSAWDSTKISMTNCTQGNRCGNIDFGGTALSFDGKTYYWKIKYWDDDAAEGTYSDCTANFTILGPGDQMRHGNYFFNKRTEGVFSW